MIDVNQKAPEFTLPDDQGNKVSLADYQGRHVVLYFYPKDDTPGCTKEACAFSDGLSQFNDMDVAILGVSKDSVEKHRKFKAKYDLKFPLLSDADDTVCEDYGVWNEKSMYGKTFMGIDRTTFLIGPDGFVRHVWTKVKVDGHADEIAETIQNFKKKAA